MVHVAHLGQHWARDEGTQGPGVRISFPERRHFVSFGVGPFGEVEKNVQRSDHSGCGCWQNEMRPTQGPGRSSGLRLAQKTIK
jgi:hypothetical protein